MGTDTFVLTWIQGSNHGTTTSIDTIYMTVFVAMQSNLVLT
jgi:hypothetical protein